MPYPITNQQLDPMTMTSNTGVVVTIAGHATANSGQVARVSYHNLNYNLVGIWPFQDGQALNATFDGTNIHLQNPQTQTTAVYQWPGPARLGAEINNFIQENVMSTPYGVTILMDDNTVTNLTAGGYNLYGFKAVQGPTGGAPLVWVKTNQFGLSTAISWQEQYQAFTSTSSISGGTTINVSNPYDINLANTLNVTGQTGTGSVVTSGVANAISINNQTSVKFTCGISQVQNNGPANPLCAFNLYGNMLDLIVPIEKVLLMFSSTPVNTGTVIMQSYSQCVLIDLTSQNTRTLGFDINNGWQTKSQVGMDVYPANTSMVPLLIQSSAFARKLMLR